jgi:hypothetical protein
MSGNREVRSDACGWGREERGEESREKSKHKEPNLGEERAFVKLKHLDTYCIFKIYCPIRWLLGKLNGMRFRMFEYLPSLRTAIQGMSNMLKKTFQNMDSLQQNLEELWSSKLHREAPVNHPCTGAAHVSYAPLLLERRQHTSEQVLCCRPSSVDT